MSPSAESYTVTVDDDAGTNKVICDTEDDDKGHPWEVRVFVDSGRGIRDVDITYPLYDNVVGQDLGGALALSLVVDESIYSAHTSPSSGSTA